MSTKYILHYFLFLAIALTFFSFSTHSEFIEVDLAKLNGKWELPCYEYFNSSGELECASLIEYTYIKVDIETGEGIESYMDGYSKGTRLKVFKENNKTMIDYFLPPNNEQLRGEIITLDDKELKVKFEKKGFYTIQQRAKK